jgi:hypothetical protein
MNTRNVLHFSWHNIAWHNIAWHNIAWHNIAWHNIAWHNKTGTNGPSLGTGEIDSRDLIK